MLLLMLSFSVQTKVQLDVSLFDLEFITLYCLLIQLNRTLKISMILF